MRNYIRGMDDNHFTGSFQSLFQYWQDENRAKKFEKGGTRIKAVYYLLNRAEVEIHKGVWIDTAIGAGFVQKQLYQTVRPSLMVGIDISRAMLDKVDEPVERIMGSAFHLPIREEVANLATNIFCLSDYPDPSKALTELGRVIKRTGIFMYLDYSDQDEYWLKRQENHDNETVIGNINLRNSENIRPFLPKNLREVAIHLIDYTVETMQFDQRINLPDTITRSFLFVEMYKPRSG